MRRPARNDLGSLGLTLPVIGQLNIERARGGDLAPLGPFAAMMTLIRPPFRRANPTLRPGPMAKKEKRKASIAVAPPERRLWSPRPWAGCSPC